MAKETKVGLLTGLAFIVCFAVILANRGTVHRPPADAGYGMYEELDRGGVDAYPRSAQGYRDSGTAYQRGSSRQPAGYGQARPRRVDDHTYDRNWRDPRGDSIDVSIQRGTSIPNVETHDSYDDDVYEVDDRNRSSSRDDGYDESQFEPVDAPGDGEAQDGSDDSPYWGTTRLDYDDTATLMASGFSRVDPPPGEERAAEKRGPEAATTYVVVAGDSLSKIARQQYGRAAGTIVDAIFDANRGVLSSPDAINIGMKLVLPVIHVEGGTVAPKGGRHRASKPATSKARRATQEDRQRGWRWYQICRGDNLVGIARQELGDPSRWEELRDMNKDRFPDPRLIREGVLIRLPLE